MDYWLKIKLSRLVFIAFRVLILPRMFQVLKLLLLNAEVNCLAIPLVLNLANLGLELIVLSLELFDNVHEHFTTLLAFLGVQSIKILRNFVELHML